MKRQLRILTAMVLLTFCLTGTALAQDPDGWNDADSADTPVDGGLSLLLAAGAGYGIKKYRQQQKGKSA